MLTNRGDLKIVEDLLAFTKKLNLAAERVPWPYNPKIDDQGTIDNAEKLIQKSKNSIAWRG